MTPEEIAVLQKKNEITNRYVSAIGNPHAIQIQQLFKDGKLKLVSATHGDTWYPEKELDLNNDRSIQTYPDCAAVSLMSDYRIELRIFHGPRGAPQHPKIRAVFLLEGEWWSLPVIPNIIEHNWDLYTQDLMQRELDAKQERRRQEIGNLLLADNYKIPDE